MKCTSQISSLIADNIGSYVPNLRLLLRLKPLLKNITGGSKTTPYTMTCWSPLQLIVTFDANTNTTVNNIHTIYMVNKVSIEEQ